VLQQTRGRADPLRVAAMHDKAIELVRLSVEMTAEAGSGHPSSAASLAHLVVTLLYGHMRWDPARPDHPAGDRLVLSEGHACPVVYAAGADLGMAIEDGDGRRPMTRADALRLREIDSPVDGHPHPQVGVPFFPAATGSLGQGLSVANGLALAARLDGLSRRVFCLIGDGESREGQIWEALDFLVDHELTGVCPIFNANGEGQTGSVSVQQSPSALAAKLGAYGLEPILLDGHEPAEIEDALARHAERSGARDVRPVALVARTVKGWGMPTLSGQTAGRHGKPVTGDALRSALEELERKHAEVGARPAAEGAWRIPPPPDETVPEARTSSPPRTLRATLAEHDEEDQLEKGKLATRKAYGAALRALGETRDDLVVLDGDVSNSTYAKVFAEAPDLGARFFECRIAEQNMVSCAAGLAAGGKLPFASSFGKFLQRTYDQAEMALIGGLPVRLVGSHVGVGPAADGPSQMALTDAAWFASLGRMGRNGVPLMHVLTPSDPVSAYVLTLEMAAHDGACYLRVLRSDVPVLYDEDDDRFPIGGHRVLREGGDVMIGAWGFMVHRVLEAAKTLADEGVSATVVDLYSLPFDEEAIVALAGRNRGRVLTVEDNAGGAVGAAVAEALAGAGGSHALRRLTVRGVPKSGRTPDDVLDRLGLSHDHVVDAARRVAT